MVSKSRHSWHRKPCCITAIRITAGVLTAATCCISVRHRGYASIDLFKIDADTGATTLLVQEKAEPYADYYGHRYWLREQQNEIYRTSDVGGWKHYYLYDAQSGKTTGGADQWQLRR
jgi:hypothetical protein